MLHSLDTGGWEHTAWCVPSALACVTGIPVAKAHSLAAFSTHRDITKIEGMIDEETLLLANRLDLRLERIDLTKRYDNPPRLRDLEMTMLEKASKCLWVLADKKSRTNHMIATHCGWACDNWTKRPVPLSEFPRLYRQVLYGWRVV